MHEYNIVQPVHRKNFFDSRLAETLLVAAAGGVIYFTLEVLWRGWSHISMALCGALCLYGFYAAERDVRFRCRPLILRAVCGALLITAVEFAAGCIVNLWLGLDVWSYENAKFNLLGQICLKMSLIWLLISLAAFPLCDLIRRKIFHLP